MTEIEDIVKNTSKPKYDSVKLGAVLGLLTPAIIFLVYYYAFYKDMALGAFYHYLVSADIFLPVMSLCIYAGNLLLFFAFIWTKRDKSARGVLMATILYTIYVAIMKIT